MKLRAPGFWQRRGALSFLLSPLSWVFQGGTHLRRLTAQVHRSRVPVICVGNATAGGAGKTPTVAAIAAMLGEDDKRAVIVSRGYGGHLAGPVQVAPGHGARQVGDEPKMLSARFPVWIGRKRAKAVAAAEGSADVLILDDGLQNPTVIKTLSLLVIDGEAGIGNGRVLPAGPMRESLGAALRKADAVVLIGEDRHGLKAKFGARQVFAARLVADTETLPVSGRRFLAFAGIGRPEKFFATLVQEGGALAGCRPFPDHYRYSEGELLSLELEAASLGAVLVTTEKDAVRLPVEFRARIAVLPVRLVFAEEDRFRAFLKRGLIKR